MNVQAAAAFHYQPQHSIATGQTVGHEALLRPAKPDVIAGNPDLACLAVKEWQRLGHLSVNVERPHLEYVLSRLVFDPGLTIEITERGGMPTAAEIAAVRAAGFRVSLDDVEPGDVQEAIELRPDEIKFVLENDLDGIERAIRLAVIARIEVVVEKIETPADLVWIRGCGATTGQGWLWSRAEPVTARLHHLTRLRTSRHRCASPWTKNGHIPE